MSDNTLIHLQEWEKLIKLDPKGMAAIMPYVKEIFLIDCRVAGTGHIENADSKSADLGPDSLLMFKREPDNPYDANAICILNQKQEKLGYVPKAKK